MTDPRDFDRRMDMERQAEMERTTGTSTPWGWIAAAVFVIVILALVFAGGENTRTAREDASPPATTGMAPRTTPPTAPFLRDRRRRQTGRAGNSSDDLSLRHPGSPSRGADVLSRRAVTRLAQLNSAAGRRAARRR